MPNPIAGDEFALADLAAGEWLWLFSVLSAAPEVRNSGRRADIDLARVPPAEPRNHWVKSRVLTRIFSLLSLRENRTVSSVISSKRC